MDVVQQQQSRFAAPQRRHPGNTVPNLYERVELAHPAGEFCSDRSWEHIESAAASHDGVPVAGGSRRQPGRCGRAVQDVEASICPASHEVIGVYLGPAGIDVVEIAPRKHMHSANSLLLEILNELVDSLGRIGWVLSQEEAVERSVAGHGARS